MSKRGKSTPSPAYQVSETLKTAFGKGFGRGRHEDKRNAQNEGKHYTTYTKDKIYAGKTYKTDVQKCITVMRYAKTEFGVKYIKDLKPEHFNAFVQRGMITKPGEPYSKRTAESYAAAIQKLQDSYNALNNTNLTFLDRNYMEHVVIKEQQRHRMPSDIHDKIIAKAYQQDERGRSDNGRAFEMARAAGLRVSEITRLRMRDFRTDENGKIKEVVIHRSKGGKTTVKEFRGEGKSYKMTFNKFTEQQQDKIQTLYDHYKDKGLKDMDKLFPNRPESYEQAFYRYREEIAPGQYTQCGIHSMRREWGQGFYERELERRIEGRLQEMGNNYCLTEKDYTNIEKGVREDLTELFNHHDPNTILCYLDGSI
ncbi:MAG TPA: hypothetical protein PLL87_10270 [Syntrophorhabdaceae bacterium]|nr:hypothetical protein [Syntrophorhabdaceae bacterium]